jgi:RNA polymerase sigma-32 factor
MSSAISVDVSPSLSSYLHRVGKYPMLSLEEERALARRWHQDQDSAAGHRLVSSHLRLVAKIANGYRGYGLPFGELISEGNVGIMQAVNRFDPDRGVRLATYASWWIRAAIQDYVLRSRSLVKMGTTASQKKLFFNLRRVKAEIAEPNQSDLTPEQVGRIAHILDVSERDVVSMNDRLAALDQSLNTPFVSDGEGELQDRLADEADSPESLIAESEELADRKALLANALKTLNRRELQILSERRLKEEPSTLEELSRQHCVSRERIRQLENNALTKLKNAMKEQRAKRRCDRPHYQPVGQRSMLKPDAQRC